MKKRSASIKRKTKETDIAVELNLDGQGASAIKTGIPFMDHMLTLLAKHSLIDMKITAKGDLEVDCHHTVEDIGLALGMALDKALGSRVRIRRYGWSLVPMDESLGRVAVDLGGRPYLVYQTANKRRKIVDFDLGLIEEFFRAVTVAGRLNLHVSQLYGRDPHHAYEAIFKAVANALRMACAIEPRARGVPSTKGKI